MNVRIDGAEIDSRDKLHDALVSGLNLPTWYGHNLDALHDCLTDIPEDTVLMVSDWSTLQTALGSYADAFERVLRDAAKENPHFHFAVYTVTIDRG